MPTLRTNIGTGPTGYQLVCSDARDIPAALTVWMHEAARRNSVCVEAIAAFSGLVTGVVDHSDRLRGEFEAWLADKEATRAAYAAKMQEAA